MEIIIASDLSCIYMTSSLEEGFGRINVEGSEHCIDSECLQRLQRDGVLYFHTSITGVLLLYCTKPEL